MGFYYLHGKHRKKNKAVVVRTEILFLTATPAAKMKQRYR